MLKPGGIYCSTDLGFLWQNLFLALWTSIFGSKKVIFPIPKDRKEDILFFKELIEAGKFRPVIDRCYPLEQIAEAYKYVETGSKNRKCSHNCGVAKDQLMTEGIEKV